MNNSISADTSNSNQPDNQRDINRSTLFNNNTRIEEAQARRLHSACDSGLLGNTTEVFGCEQLHGQNADSIKCAIKSL